MRPFRSFLLSLSLLAGAAMPAFAQGVPASVTNTPEQQTALDALYAKARDAKEDTVVIYTPYSRQKGVWKAFEADFPGIKVTPGILWGPELISRLVGERSSGNHAADVVSSGIVDVLPLFEQGYFVEDVPPTLGSLPANYRDGSGFYQVPFTNLFALIYNTNLVKEDEVPNTLQEALQDKWKGKLTFAKFTGANVSDMAVATLRYNKALPDGTLDRLHEIGVSSEEESPLIANVAQGRFALGLWAPTQNVVPLQAEGAPIKIKYLADSDVLIGPGAALAKDAPHPNAGRLLKAWFFSNRGQAAFTNFATAYGTQPGIAEPKGLPRVEGYSLKDLPLSGAEAIVSSSRDTTRGIWGE